MKKYKVNVIIHSETTKHFHEYILEKIVDFDYSSAGCYIFRDDDHKRFYFPIVNSIVIEM